MKNQLILMHEVCDAHPKEWPALVLIVEYLLATAPQGDHGLSAHDLSCAHSIASSTDQQLGPFWFREEFPRVIMLPRCFVLACFGG